MADKVEHIKKLTETHPLRESILRSAIRTLKLPSGSRGLGWFQEIGLLEPESRTFMGDVQAPLSKKIRTALLSLIEMLWGERQPGVSEEDWAEYQRLCLPESPDFILNLPDYCAFFTYSVFWGRVRG